MAFPASQIQELERPADGPARMRVNFMGLTGPSGVLPLMYSELVIDRLRARDRTMRDFFDIFNHRMISLFYQAWEKYRFTIPYERGERDRFSHHLLALLGLGTPGLQDRQDVSDDSLLFYAGLLSLHARSATALRQVLADYFDVPVEIEQFVGAWYPLDRESQCSHERNSELLGPAGVWRGGGGRDLGPAIARADSDSGRSRWSGTWISCRAARPTATFARWPAFSRGKNTMWRSSSS